MTKLTAPQARLLDKIRTCPAAPFKMIGRALCWFERDAWRPVLLFGRGERVAFEGLLAAGAITRVGSTATDAAMVVAPVERSEGPSAKATTKLQGKVLAVLSTRRQLDVCAIADAVYERCATIREVDACGRALAQLLAAGRVSKTRLDGRAVWTPSVIVDGSAHHADCSAGCDVHHEVSRSVEPSEAPSPSKVEKALLVFLLDPKLRELLAERDPKALAQAFDAIAEEGTIAAEREKVLDLVTSAAIVRAHDASERVCEFVFDFYSGSDGGISISVVAARLRELAPGASVEIDEEGPAGGNPCAKVFGASPREAVAVRAWLIEGGLSWSDEFGEIHDYTPGFDDGGAQ